MSADTISPLSFCQLMGYEDHEVIGRNCQFLQSPDGRGYVTLETIQHLYNTVISDREYQASIINYRKGGQAFINLITITRGVQNTSEEADEVVYHVGFQIDLTEQSNAILQRLWDGSYIVDYDTGGPAVPSLPAPPPPREHRVVISKDPQAFPSDPAFINLLPVSTSTTVPTSENTHELSHLLNLILLEYSLNFIHILSLKGFFLYVTPSIQNVLRLEGDELVGKLIVEYCHPADLVPLTHELKKLSTPSMTGRKTVDLLFRARSAEGYVWVESRGWLHIKLGKGRKAIMLSGCVRLMPMMRW